ncbi:MAG TPA: nucleotidyltransferase domain-containing protein, partial [Pseudoxanthomonas sp.]|nr:nucleotidyltransferase domain-containing protein [Pseudoxanthomonas sp.]
MELNQLRLAVDPPAPVLRLRDAFGAEWPNITASRQRSAATLELLKVRLTAAVPPDTTLVVFGSLARNEFTEGSDVDWTLLVDGAANPEHWDTTQRIRAKLASLAVNPPTAGGAFGSLTFSHDLIHKIGGDDDTNQNTTQRLLLLLESAHIGPAAAYDQVVGSILRRYIEEDLLPNETPFRVPRFLLNDFARYWRTMAVDFAHKRRVRQGDKWALRTTKLRLSRKLLYSAGLLSCYLCGEEFRAARRANPYHDAHQVTQFLAKLVGTTPLDIVARVVLDSFGETSVAGRQVFDTYDEFLGMMNDTGKRETLKRLRPNEADSNAVYQEARQL